LNRLLPVVVAGGDEGRLAIHQDVTFLLGRIEPEVGVSHALAAGRSAYLFVASREIEAAGKTLVAGNALEYTGEPEVAVRGRAMVEVVLFDLPG
jgi:hypothetical protein